MYIAEEYLNSDFDDARVHLKDMMKDALETMESLESNPRSKLNYYDAIDTLNVIIEYCESYKIDVNMLKTIKPKVGADVLKALNNFYFGK